MLRYQELPHPLAEVMPQEYRTSLAMPVRHFPVPAFAFFASATTILPDQPVVQDTPACWWVIGADDGQLLLFARWEILPFKENQQWTEVSLPKITLSVIEYSILQDDFAKLMDAVTPDFFTSKSGDPEQKQSLSETISQLIPEVIYPQYQALAPDFFRWLRS
jgi:hypothetical protein